MKAKLPGNVTNSCGVTEQFTVLHAVSANRSRKVVSEIAISVIVKRPLRVELVYYIFQPTRHETQPDTD